MARITYLFCIFAILLMAPVSAQDFREGLRAFQSGENERAASAAAALAARAAALGAALTFFLALVSKEVKLPKT